MTSSDNTDNTITAKSVAMSVLFIASLTLGTLPLALSRIFYWNANSQNNRYVQRMLCLGGGVLLCTTFIHLLPEVSEKIEGMDNIPVKQIHYAEVLMCVGFFTMYLVEELVHSCLDRHENNALVRTLSVRKDTLTEKPKLELSPDGPITICTQDRSHIDHSHNDHSHIDHSHSHSHMHPEDFTIKTIRGLFIVLALSVHELFEGLAVGLESSSKNVWYMFGAVSAHKLVIAFCIGVELVTSGVKSGLIVLYVFIFAVVSPMGIGMGLIITEDGEDTTALPSVVLQGLATGTLLYVVFFEILSAERKSGLWNFFAVLGGFSMMFVIKIFGE